MAGWLRADNLATVLLVFIAIATAVLFYNILTSKQISSTERKRVTAFVPLFPATGAYWTLYSQSYTVIIAFFDKCVERTIWAGRFRSAG